MTSPPKKNYATATAAREVARFERAMDEFDCRWNEAQFGDTVYKLASVDWSPRDENDSRPAAAPVALSSVSDNVTGKSVSNATCYLNRSRAP